jgi:hypothetical protein
VASKAEAVLGLLRGCTELNFSYESLSGAACEALSVVLQVSPPFGVRVGMCVVSSNEFITACRVS